MDREYPPIQDLPGVAPFCRVLVGFDRHPASHRAVLVAAELDRALGASLLVLHVIDLADYPVDPEAANWDSAVADTLAAERQHAERLLSGTPIPWMYRTARDDPAHALARIAHDMDALFIVVGA